MCEISGPASIDKSALFQRLPVDRDERWASVQRTQNRWRVFVFWKHGYANLDIALGEPGAFQTSLARCREYGNGPLLGVVNVVDEDGAVKSTLEVQAFRDIHAPARLINSSLSAEDGAFHVVLVSRDVMPTLGAIAAPAHAAGAAAAVAAGTAPGP